MENDDRPAWLRLGLSTLGTKELPGKQTNPLILRWWTKIRAPFTDDETPWCAAFVGGLLEDCGLVSTRSAAARSYQKWGQPLDGAAVGAIAVFWRGSPQAATGHVGIVVGRDQNNSIMILGGNQGDCVSIKPFFGSRLLGYRWPLGVPLPKTIGITKLPLVLSDGKHSVNEA
jgi:uncharacterized protein (TIGR02594 family)